VSRQGLARTILDLGARWFDARAAARERSRPELHAHWDPASRDWRYHVHSEEPVQDDDAAAAGGSPN